MSISSKPVAKAKTTVKNMACSRRPAIAPMRHRRAMASTDPLRRSAAGSMKVDALIRPNGIRASHRALNQVPEV